ncbi:MAG TPA: outer membrane protein assembly factor BamA [Bdellovibrionales bacterium]|nr:outer membrane protein assembly factor BamA [Bdellovibrionales bacterium]
MRIPTFAVLLSIVFCLVNTIGHAQTLEQTDREPAQARKRSPSRRATTPRAAAKPAVEGLVVGTITVKGNKKIEVDAVQARLTSKTGEAYSPEKVRADVDALFKTGYFYDVKVDRSVRGGAADLTYTVVEKPSVTEISYSGNEEVETGDLEEAAGLKAFEILNMTKIREATEKIQKLYEDKGFFLARITPRIKTIQEGESVSLKFEIQENEKVKVKRVTILGNEKIPDGKLKAAMQTQEGGFFSFVSGSGAYKQDAFDRDIQLLQYLYFNEGYVQIKVDRPQVYVTPDKKGIYITVRVEEGNRFKVGNVDFAGDLLFSNEDLFNSIHIEEQEWYTHEILLKDLRELQAKYGDLGYAYANIIPRTRIREADREVDITFEIDKGNKVYFNRITVIGNSKTRDKVVRRELEIKEGELYNETRRRESLANVQRLGYFDDVQFNSSTPADGPDLMNLDIVVKERNTGSIQVGAGYSTYSSFIFNGQVNQTNLFGRGQKLGISIDLSGNQSLYNFNFTEPYFLDTEWSLGFDAYQSQRKLSPYDETKKGGAVRVGHPLAPYLRGYIRYKLDSTEIDLDDKLGDPDLYPVSDAAHPDVKGDGNGITSSGTGTIEYDRRNDRFSPTDGVFASGSLEYAGLGGDKRFTKGFFSGRFYKKIWSEVVFRNNLTYGFVRSNEPGDEPPFNELFLLGGANSLRGYDWFSVGKKKLSRKLQRCYADATPDKDSCPRADGNPLSGDELDEKSMVPYGGTQQAFYNLEFEFPLISEAGIKGVVFYDVGNADDILTLSEYRMDFGFGFRWFSPIGPLRFEWGFPIDRQPDERAVNFQFAIGSPF